VLKLSIDDRAFGARLGLGDIAELDRPVCMGFQMACVCSECIAREEMEPREPAKQFPWEEVA